MEPFDLVVIGGGPGGYTAAASAARMGLRTALVEADTLGGTCVSRGCVPTKAMLRVADTLRALRQGGMIGVLADDIRLDYNRMLAYRQGTVDRLTKDVADTVRAAGVTVLQGRGQVASEGRVYVTAAGGEKTTLYGKAILLATGSRPKMVPVPGGDLPGVLDSDGLFALQELPKSLVIVGGGVIGVEIAEALSAMGTEVTLAASRPRLLPKMDREIGQNLRLILKKRGVKLLFGAALQRVSQAEEGLQCRFSVNDEEVTASAQYVLCAVGRRPNSEGLFAEDLHPELSPAGHVLVDEHFLTSLPGVYAIGDLVPGMQLAHLASAEGRAVAELLAGKHPVQELSVIPRCVYTSPEIAEVGLSEQEAAERGISVLTRKALMSANGRTVIQQGERGFIKVIKEAETGVIIGAALMCERATDIVGEFTVAIANRMTAAQMRRAVRPHPTFEEAVYDSLL